MQDVQITIPGDALAAAKIPRHRLESELKLQLAMQLFREGLVSGAGACRIAGVAKSEFQFLLGERGICQQYGVDDFHKDIEHLAAWRKNDS